MQQTVPDFTTAIVTISFLLVLAIIAYIVKIKSVTLKKIIKKQDNLEVLNQISLRNGYLAFVFKVGEENFFFVGHKTGRGSLTQIHKDNPSLDNNKTINFENLSKNKSIKSNNIANAQSEEKKPLQHVNISDLLTAHKKGGNDA
jgi:hypothetical protein